MQSTIQPKLVNPLPLWALFTANSISLVGNIFAAIAIPWFVLQTTGSATQTGITGFFNFLPVIVAGLLGGALIDRLGFKWTSIISDLASGVTVALVPILYFTVGLQFWQLMVLVFLGALLDAPGGTAREALLPDLAKMADMPIERATSINHIIERGSRVVGAPLAGILIALIGTANVLWLDAASFLISAALIGILVSVPQAPRQAKQRSNYFEEILDGLRFIRRDKLIFAIVTTVMITNFLDVAYGGVILPVFVKTVYGEAVNLGILLAANGGGAVLGAVIFGAIGHKLPRHATFVLMFMLTSVRFWVFALYPPFWVAATVTFIASLGAGPLNPIISAVQYERIPIDLRGRVFGAITAGAWAATPLGVLLGGVLTEQFGVRSLLLMVGASMFLTTLSMAFIPAMREMNRRTPENINT